MIAEANFWDRQAEKYSRRPIKNMAAYEATMTRVAALMNPTDKVLEIGCGTGATALRLAPGVAEYTGSDISPEMVRIARERQKDQDLPHLDFTVAPAVETRFETGTYDAVLGFNLLHLLPNYNDVPRRAHELLRPGGLLITKTPCLGQMGFLPRLIVPVMMWYHGVPHVGFLTAKELERSVQDAGFDLIETRAFEGAPDTWFIAARKR